MRSVGPVSYVDYRFIEGGGRGVSIGVVSYIVIWLDKVEPERGVFGSEFLNLGEFLGLAYSKCLGIRSGVWSLPGI